MKSLITTLFLLPYLTFGQDYTFDKTTGKAKPNFVAQTTLFKGDVFKLTGDKKEKVEVGTRFYKNDTVLTQDKSFIKLKVVDDTIMALGPNSQLNFETFQFIEKDDRKAVYNLIKGQLRGHFKVKAKDGDLTVKTSTAAMGIRGTEILVTHQEVEFKELSDFVLLSGSAFILDKALQKHDIKKSERVVTALDPKTNQSSNEKTTLPENELDRLKAMNINERKNFKPFLPYIILEDIKKDSPLYSFFHASEQKNSDNEESESDSSPTKEKPAVWKSKLKKLNKKLKQNQY